MDFFSLKNTICKKTQNLSRSSVADSLLWPPFSLCSHSQWIVQICSSNLPPPPHSLEYHWPLDMEAGRLTVHLHLSSKSNVPILPWAVADQLLSSFPALFHLQQNTEIFSPLTSLSIHLFVSVPNSIRHSLGALWPSLAVSKEASKASLPLLFSKSNPPASLSALEKTICCGFSCSLPPVPIDYSDTGGTLISFLLGTRSTAPHSSPSLFLIISS